jgi:hypothetical protein
MGDRVLETQRAEVNATLRDFNGFFRQVGVYIIVVILASGGAFMLQPMIAGDDWWAYTNRAHWQGGAESIEKGRPMFALFSRLAADGFALHPFDTVLFYSTLVLFSFVLFRRWFQSRWDTLLVVSLFVTSPFLVEHLQFSANQIPLSIALLLLCFWFTTIADPGRSRPASTLLGAVAAAVAITTRHELLFLLVGAALIELSRQLMFAPRPHAPILWRLLASFASTGVLVVCIVFLGSMLTGVEIQSEGNYGTSGLVSSVAQLPPLLERFARHWTTFLFRPHHLFPFPLKVATLLLMSAALVRLIYTREYMRAVVFVVVAMLLSTIPLSLGLVTTNSPYRYAGVFPLALFTCYIACVALVVVRQSAWARAGIAICCMLIIAIFSANLSAAQVRLSNLNRLEFSTITQFLAQIRATGGSDWRIAVLGTFSKDKQPRGAWSTSIVECGVFDCQTWRLESLLNLMLLERQPERRVFRLSDQEKADLQPLLDQMTPGSASLTKLADDRYVILLN